jgi:hypothetical protein
LASVSIGYSVAIERVPDVACTNAEELFVRDMDSPSRLGAPNGTRIIIQFQKVISKIWIKKDILIRL